MQNEQCGICWKLKFDRNGKRTHGISDSHDFTPFDYCTKCKKPKFDHDGFVTHPSKYDFSQKQSLVIDHEFSSAANTKEISRKKKQKIIVAVTGAITLVVSPIVNFLNFLS